MQRKLTEGEIEKLKQARSGIGDVLVPTYDDQGLYWAVVLGSLDDKIKHGTTDGKPYVDPEPAIPEGWRRAEADEWKRTDVKTWEVSHDFSRGNWAVRPSHKVGKPFNTSLDFYIVPIDPPLTDEDACVWPRLLVMVRNHHTEKFHGPYRLGMVNQDGWKYTVFIKDDERDSFFQARRATPAEIEAAK
jgi:hypothetical protein